MAKLTLSDLDTLTNESAALAAINSNNASIEAALENTISRDGTPPNEMEGDIDMNSNRIINLPEAGSPTEPVRKAEFDLLAFQGQLPNISGPFGLLDDTLGLFTIGRFSAGYPWSIIRPTAASTGLELRSFAGTPQVTLTQSTGTLSLLTGGLVINSGGTTASLVSPGLTPTQFIGIGPNPAISYINDQNPGVNGYAFYEHWYQRNSAGALMRVATQGPGLWSTTAGHEMTSWDVGFRVDGNLQSLAWVGQPAGAAAGLAVAAAGLIPNSALPWFIGGRDAGFTKLILGNSDGNAGPVSIEMREYLAGVGGQYRIRNLGASLIVQKNTSALMDFATATTVLALSATGITGTIVSSVIDNTNGVTLRDNSFILQDDGDVTKQAVFQLSGISTATTRSYTFPNSSGTLTLNDSTATLTNKTFDTAGAGNSFLINGLAATANTGTGSVVRATTPTLTTPVIGVATGTSLAVTGALTSSSASAGVGYATGAGSTVTQATSKSTAVTLNNICGTITMNNALLVNFVPVSFTLNNSTIAATDVVVVSIKGGTAGTNTYQANVTSTTAGACTIMLQNVTSGALGEAVILSFAVIKAVAA